MGGLGLGLRLGLKIGIGIGFDDGTGAGFGIGMGTRTRAGTEWERDGRESELTSVVLGFLGGPGVVRGHSL